MSLKEITAAGAELINTFPEWPEWGRNTCKSKNSINMHKNNLKSKIISISQFISVYFKLRNEFKWPAT